MYQLRDYQIAAVEAGAKCLSTGRNGIIVAPTGSGKSLLIASLLVDLPGKSLVLQPSKEILEQNKAKTEAFGVRDIGVWSASCGRKDMGKITFATIGSIKRKEQFADFDRIVVDEVHAVNPKGGMYEDLITSLGLPTIGLTATPYRLRSFNDSFGGGNRVAVSTILTRTRPRIFSKIVHVTQVQELFRAGFLCPLEYTQDLSYDATQIRPNSTGQNYDEDALAQYNRKLEVPEKVARAATQSKAKHVLAFTQFRAESQTVLDLLRKAGVTCAEVSAETPRDDRERIIADFKSGAIKCVVNVACLTTGFDFPELDCVILGRPTRSVALYYQMTGRGIRPAPGKAGCTLIDLCDNVRRFGRIETFDLYDQNGNGMWRLRSNAGFLTGADVQTGMDMEKIKPGKPHKKASPGDVLTFGKYKDTPLSQVPKGYLVWGAENLSMKAWAKAFRAELERRNVAVAG